MSETVPSPGLAIKRFVVVSCGAHEQDLVCFKCGRKRQAVRKNNQAHYLYCEKCESFEQCDCTGNMT